MNKVSEQVAYWFIYFATPVIYNGEPMWKTCFGDFVRYSEQEKYYKEKVGEIA